MSTKLPGLKNIPPKTDRELKLALEDIKQALEIRLGLRGDPLDRAVTLRELKDSNIVQVKNSEVGVSGGIKPPDEDPSDLTVPPAPTTLTASGAFTSIVLKWNNPSYGNHGFTEIWRSQDNNLAGAELVSTAGGQIYTEEVGYNVTYFYWVRFVSTSNIPGPWNDTEGTSAQTAVDVGAVLTTLNENLSNLPGYDTLTGLISAANAEGAEAARVIKSSSAPTTRADGSAIQPNDIWYDTDDGQVHTRNSSNNAWVAARDATLVNLFGSTSFTGSTLSGAMATAQGDIVTVTNAQSATATEVTNLTAKVDTKNQTFIQDDAPADNATNDLQDGDLWIDSNDDNKLYRWNSSSSSWVVVRDTSNDGKATVFTQDNVPTSGVKKGDIWFDTNDNNKQYRADSDGSDQVATGEWEEVRDVTSQAAIATNATAIADETSARTSAINSLTATVNTNTASISTNASAIATETSARTSAISSLTATVNGNTADISTNTTAIADETSARGTAITNLEAKVDKKNKTFIQDNAPANNTDNDLKDGDLWIDSNDANKLYRWDGVNSPNAWDVVRDTTNDGKATVFTQDDVPTSGVKKGDIWFDTDDSNKQYRAAADGADQVTSGEWEVVRDVLTQAGVTTVQNAIANGTTAEAGYGVAVNANGAVAGMYIMAQSDGTLQNNTSTTSIVFEANQVVIRDTNSGGTNIQPFVVLTSTDSDGNAPGVYIDSAFIKDASITAAQIGSLSADLVNAVDINAGSITAGTMSADRISGGVIQSTDLSTSGSTTIHGANITTGTIDAARIDASFIQATDLSSSGSTTIDGSRITTGQIDAARINVTDLVLPVAHNKVTGTTIGSFFENDMTVREVGSIGTQPGLYSGYVRINGSDTQVKTLSFFIGDGTFGSGSEIDSTLDNYNNHPNTQNLPMVDVGGVQYHSNRAEAFAGIARFQTAQASCQLAVTFRKRSNTDRTAKLYILAQGDGGSRSLDSVEYAFTRLAVNEPVPFTFTDVTLSAGNTLHTHAAITLTGAGFTGGTLTLTGDSSAEFRIDSGSYQTGSATVEAGDTFQVRMTSAPLANGASRSCTVTVNNVSDTFTITNATTGSPPGPTPPPSGPPPGPGGGNQPV